MQEENERAPRSRERGKGKNNKGTQRIFFSVSCLPQKRDEIKELAEKQNMNVSEFVLFCVDYWKNLQK